MSKPYEERPARPVPEGVEATPDERAAYQAGDRPYRSASGERSHGRRPGPGGPGGSSGSGGPGRSLGASRGGNPRRRRQKVSKFDEWGIETIDYKDVERLKEFLSEHAKILSRRVTGSRAKHQRSLTRAIKRARYMALLPYVGKIEKHRSSH